ncbi:MAG: hypothetical protein COB78_09985 [Hyphomicrobiales bacterium]|nr:MAG: hypothetical protein COB78_09985 [Hyphomicrobiales bacterium]
MGQIGIWQIGIVAFYAALLVIPFWRIFKRSGWPPALSLLMAVPLVNVVLLWIFAFSKWKPKSD